MLTLFRSSVLFICIICLFCVGSFHSVSAQTKTGYATVKDNQPSFEITLDPDLPSKTTPTSFVVSGSIKAFKAVDPSLTVAYGIDPDNLKNIYSVAGGAFYNGKMNTGDIVDFTSEKITVSSLPKDSPSNTIYFAIVDNNDRQISYTGIIPIDLVANDGKTNYYIPADKTTKAPDIQGQSTKGGILAGICTDVSTCDFNELLKLFTSFWKFIIILIIPIMALMAAWIGFNFMQQGSEYVEKAKEMTFNMVKGILLVLFAWLIVNTILTFILGENSCYSFLGKGNINDPKCQAK